MSDSSQNLCDLHKLFKNIMYYNLFYSFIIFFINTGYLLRDIDTSHFELMEVKLTDQLMGQNFISDI